MNRLKSIFISGFLMTEFIFIVLIAKEFSTDFKIQEGLSISIAAFILLMFAKFFLVKTPRTSPNLSLFSVILGLQYVAFLTLTIMDQNLDFNLLIFNTFGLLGWVVYLKWYSVFPNRDKNALKVGELMPNLSLLDINGSSISTNNFRGGKVLYMFYRANWCPLCMAQIKEIAGQYQALASRDVKIVMISPQPQKKTKGLANKFDVPFTFLTDQNSNAAKELGIFHEAGTPLGMEILGYDSDTVMPTVIITDEQGVIVFADLTDNYRVRPEPEIFLKVLDELK